MDLDNDGVPFGDLTLKIVFISLSFAISTLSSELSESTKIMLSEIFLKELKHLDKFGDSFLPITINVNSLMSEVLTLMENRESQISVLPVIADEMKCVGLIRIHDIYQTRLL